MYGTIESFRTAAVSCGADYYSDASLEPRMIEAAYRIYRNAAGGTKLRDIGEQVVDFGITIVGRLARRESDGEWVPSNESFPSIDQIMRENLGMNDDTAGDSGSILSTGNWSLLANDAWLLGGIHAQTEFHFASPLTWENLWSEARGHITITAREAIGIAAFGYRIVPTALEPVAVCMDKHRAGAATLPAYKKAVQACQTAAALRSFHASFGRN